MRCSRPRNGKDWPRGIANMEVSDTKGEDASATPTPFPKALTGRQYSAQGRPLRRRREGFINLERWNGPQRGCHTSLTTQMRCTTTGNVELTPILVMIES